MTIDDLELFGALAERRSITEAARAAAMSQPTASRRLQSLERELGVSLVNRDSFPVSLTPFGYLFLDFADEVLQKYRALRLNLMNNHSVIGTLTVATSSSPAARLVTHWIADFLTAHPGSHVRLTETTSALVESHILAGDATIGFMGTPPVSSDLTALAIGHDEIILLIPHHAPFLNLPHPVPWDLIYRLPFVRRAPGSGTQETVQAQLEKSGLPALTHVVLEVDTGSAVIDAVESGLGAGFVSRELLFRRELTKSSPCPIKNLSIVRPFYCVYQNKPGKNQPLVNAFLQYATLRVKESV